MSRLYVKPSDISKLDGCTLTHASRLLNQVRDALGKDRKKPVTLEEYCNYFQVPKAEVSQFLCIAH